MPAFPLLARSAVMSNSSANANATSADLCALAIIGDYDLGLHIGAVFIILGCSTMGVFSPMMAKRFPALAIHSTVLDIGKFFGGGVILATG